MASFQRTKSVAQQHIAQQRAECVVCFEDLCDQSQGQVAVLTCNGQRTCQHFMHSRCIEALKSSSSHPSCPLCRRTFDSCIVIPDPNLDPSGWFEAVDMDGDGALSMREVREVLKATISVDVSALERQLPLLWVQWDSDKNGTVDREEMLKPRTGLLAMLNLSYQEERIQMIVMKIFLV